MHAYKSLQDGLQFSHAHIHMLHDTSVQHGGRDIPSIPLVL